jgi:hypothetical protein
MKRKSSNILRGFLLTLMSIVSICLFAQNVTVRGTVADTGGEPLIGVTVQVQGKPIRTPVINYL